MPKKQRNKALDEVLHEVNSLLLSLPDGTEEHKVYRIIIFILLILLSLFYYSCLVWQISRTCSLGRLDLKDLKE